MLEIDFWQSENFVRAWYRDFVFRGADALGVFKDHRFGRVNVVVAASDPQGDADLRSAQPVTGAALSFALDSDLNSRLHKAYGDRLNE